MSAITHVVFPAEKIITEIKKQKDKEKPGTLSVTHLINELCISYHCIHESLLFMTILKHLAEKKNLQEVIIEFSMKLI